MSDFILDGFVDSLKILPYLLATFLILEFIEHKISKKNLAILEKSQKFGPVFGGIFGALPQCGFSAMAAELFSRKVITIGTVIAVFLSTSDEMLPIMIGEKADISVILTIIGIKIVIGIVVGFVVDFFLRGKERKNETKIVEFCEEEHCSCEEHGIIFSSIVHTLKIFLFILGANLLINLIIFYIGEEKLGNILQNYNFLTYFFSSFVGLIPNCAGSVIITELYLSKLIPFGVMISGLLTGSGIGLLLLFRTNKNIKENIFILFVLIFVGVVAGIGVDLL